MAKRKQFGLPATLQQGLVDTINIVEDNIDGFRNTIIPSSSIELDPENPRRLAIEIIDLPQGPKEQDPFYEIKNREFNLLYELAESIKKEGLINPILVYKYGEKYRLVAGERRYLACLIASKSNIAARVFSSKPKGLNLRLVQWYENTAREDLSLSDRIGNIKSIVKEYKVLNEQDELTPTKLAQLIGLSRPQASYYLAVINAPLDVEMAISEGKINSLDKAVSLCSIQEPIARKAAIEKVINGLPLDHIKAKAKIQKLRPGRITTTVKLGVTNNIEIVKELVNSVLNNPKFNSFQHEFSDNVWTDHKTAAEVFKKLIAYLERAINENI